MIIITNVLAWSSIKKKTLGLFFPFCCGIDRCSEYCLFRCIAALYSGAVSALVQTVRERCGFSLHGGKLQPDDKRWP